jgi:hypothetical protein
METQNLVARLPKVCPPNGVCRGCVLGKNHQAPFDTGKSWRAQKLLELFHIDIFCINLPSLVGTKYIFTFIDDLS